MEQDIANARQRGTEREPKTQHIVVHPEFPWFMDSTRMRGTYAERINGVLKDNAAIVLTYPGAKYHYDGFAYDEADAVETANESNCITGIMDDHGLRKLMQRLDGIHPNDQYVVHGSAFGMCVRATSRQVFALSEWGVYMPPTHSEEEKGHADAVRTVMDQLGLLQKRFRLGYVHNTRNRHWGLIEFDMLDSNSQVY